MLNDLSALVATLYEAAAEPQQWATFLADFYRVMDGTRGALTAVSALPELNKVVLQGYTQSEVRAYSDYYWQHDLVLQAGLQTVKQRGQWVGHLGEILPAREMEASEIYNDYYRSLDMHYATCLMVGATGPYSALGLAAWRPKARGPFRPEQLQLIDLLAPHLKQAFGLHAELTTLRVEGQALRSALEAAAIMVIALGSDGRILAASEPAEAMLSQKVVMLQRGGKLRAVHPESDRTLQRLICCAARVGDVNLGENGGKAVQPGGSLLLFRGNDLQSLQVRILPVRSGVPSTGSGTTVLAFITDPGAIPPSRERVLQDLYRLTPLESKLADLFLQGKELKQAAEELKLTYVNIRFHLKQIFRKTGTSRQTELLRLLLAVPA